MTTRVALVGAGAMGTIMARDIYPQLGGEVEVVAVVDIRIPHAGHADAAVEALDQGLHVLVEKPLALTLADCHRVERAAAAAGRVAAVAENYPHLRAVRAARAAIEAGTVGEVLALRTTRAYTLDGVWAESAWRQGDQPMAGLLWDQATHHISLLRALAGPITAVAAHRTTRRTTPGAEAYALDLTFDSGLVAQSLYCWGTPSRAVEVEATVLGSQGMIDVAVDYEAHGGGARLVRGADVTAISEPECYYDSHALIVRDWAAAIRGGGSPLVTPTSATADVAVVIAAQTSLAAGGAPVQVQTAGAAVSP
jgi:predicted dehydrogenase